MLVCRFSEMSISIMMGNAPGPDYVEFERKKKTTRLSQKRKLPLVFHISLYLLGFDREAIDIKE